MVVKLNAEQIVTLITVVTSSFLSAFTSSAVNLAVPSIGKEFAASAYLLSWIVTSYTLGSASFLLPFGRLGDVIGRKKVFLTGIFLFAALSLATAFSTGIGALIALRTLAGVAGSMMFSTATAILTSVYPADRRGAAIGLTTAATYTGLSAGPAIGGFLSQHFGWRSIFYANGTIGLLTVLFGVLFVKGEWVGAKGERYDKVGAAVYALAMMTTLYGLSSIATVNMARYIALLGIVLIVSFIKYSAKAPNPIIRVSIFRHNRAFVFSNLATMINYAATSALSFIMSLYLQVVRGLDPELAGLILLSQPIVQAIFSPIAGGLSDRIEPRVLASCGMALTTTGLLVFSFVSPTMPLWMVVANLAMIGLGFGLFSSPNTNSIMATCDRSMYGVASSFISTMRSTGQATSMAIVTVIMTLLVGNVTIGPQYSVPLVKAFRLTFSVFTALCAAGVFASLARGNVNDGNHQVAGRSA